MLNGLIFIRTSLVLLSAQVISIFLKMKRFLTIISSEMWSKHILNLVSFRFTTTPCKIIIQIYKFLCKTRSNKDSAKNNTNKSNSCMGNRRVNHFKLLYYVFYSFSIIIFTGFGPLILPV